MAKDVDHFLVPQPFEMILMRSPTFASIPYFLIGLFGFLSSSYVLEINLLSYEGLVKIFSSSVSCCFDLIDSILCLLKDFRFMSPIY